MTTALLALQLLSRAPAPSGAGHHAAGVGYVTRYNELGRGTASGQRFDARRLAVACRAVRLGTRLRITHGRRSVVAVVNDRGPWPDKTRRSTQRKLQARVRKQHPDMTWRALRVNYPLDATPAVWRALGCTDVSWVRWEVVR